MSQATSIEWTDLSWNPVHGCSKVSPGCAHCYAETLSRRYGHTERPWTPANAVMNVLVKPHTLRQPLSRARQWQGLGAAAAAAGKTDGKLVFVNSMSDLFHEEVPDEFIAEVFSVMANAPQHSFQVLTKRPKRMRSFVRRLTWTDTSWFGGCADVACWQADLLPDDHWTDLDEPATPLPNVWLGVSIENRRFVHRADLLRDTPAAVRFISAEPLLGPLVGDLTGIAYPGHDHLWMDDYIGDGLDLAGIDWLIAGGESGKGARRLDLDWMRALRDHCQDAGTAFFVKQLGGARPGNRLEDLPEDLRIREFPRQPSLVSIERDGDGGDG